MDDEASMLEADDEHKSSFIELQLATCLPLFLPSINQKQYTLIKYLKLPTGVVKIGNEYLIELGRIDEIRLFEVLLREQVSVGCGKLVLTEVVDDL